MVPIRLLVFLVSFGAATLQGSTWLSLRLLEHEETKSFQAFSEYHCALLSIASPSDVYCYQEGVCSWPAEGTGYMLSNGTQAQQGKTCKKKGMHAIYIFFPILFTLGELLN